MIYGYCRVSSKGQQRYGTSLEEQKKILDQISYEQSLIEPSKQLIKVFTKKIETRIKKVWGE